MRQSKAARSKNQLSYIPLTALHIFLPCCCSVLDLFFVGPDYLKAVIADSSKLSKLDHAYLLSFIQMRADYSENKRKILSTLNLKETTLPTTEYS